MVRFKHNALYAIWFLFISAICIAWACTSNKTKPEETISPEEAQRLEEFRAELEIGRNMAGRLLQFYGTQKDSGVLSYVNQIGTYVAKHSDFPDRKYSFEIIDSEAVNAFACPGGYILITMGALRHATNEAEIAAILAHEITHVGKKHMFDRIKSMSQEEVERANEIAQKRLELPETVLARERPKPEENVVGETLAKYMSGGAAGLSIVKAAGAGMAVMLEQGLGAEKEYEADAFGVRYAVNAGYDAFALNQYLCRLKKKDATGVCKLDNDSRKSAPKDAKNILDKTHPPIPDRIANIDKVLIELDAKNIVGAQGRNRFAKVKERLPKPKNEG